MTLADLANSDSWPTVTVVFLAYNRREELALSLRMTLRELDYDRDRLSVIVVDNASSDGTAEMVRDDYPEVRLIERSWNCGVSGWNDGFAVATGDYVLALDDDCYLTGVGLREAVAAARDGAGDLVSFGVRSGAAEDFRFDVDEYRTGLLTFWGCAVLMRREVLATLGGYDPDIFVWANEVELMLRFYDRGYRHLHLPDVIAVHAKAPSPRTGPFPERPYRFNARNFAYVAGKHLRARDSGATFAALLGQNLRDGVRGDMRAFRALGDTARGFVRGLRRRRPVRAEVSSTYRHNFEDFSNPLTMSRPLPELVRAAVGRGRPDSGDAGRRTQWRAERARFYPDTRAVLEL